MQRIFEASELVKSFCESKCNAQKSHVIRYAIILSFPCNMMYCFLSIISRDLELLASRAIIINSPIILDLGKNWQLKQEQTNLTLF